MTYSFSTECESYYGVATITAFADRHIDGLSMEENARRLLRTKALRCCFDTGASHSAIASHIADSFDAINISDTVPLSSVNAFKEVSHCVIDIALPSGIVFVGCDALVVENKIDLLIGMDVIGKGDFALTQRNGRTFLSVIWPHCFEVDFSKR